jgi:hypothetical protein
MQCETALRAIHYLIKQILFISNQSVSYFSYLCTFKPPNYNYARENNNP